MPTKKTAKPANKKSSPAKKAAATTPLKQGKIKPLKPTSIDSAPTESAP